MKLRTGGRPLFVCLILAAACQPESPASAEDLRTEIEAAMDSYLDAWEAGDSASLAAHFTADFEWMNPVGMVLESGATTAQFLGASHQAQDQAGVERSLTQSINGIRFVGNGVALVDLTYVHVGPRQPPPEGVARSFVVMVKEEGRWVRTAQRNFHLVQPR